MLNKETMVIITGSLLGDGCISRNKYRHRYEVERKYEDIEYSKWLYDILKSDIKGLNHIVRERERRMNGYVFKSKMCRIYSKYYNEMTVLRHMFYKDNIKYISDNILEYITPLSMAVWYMDDGSYDINRFTIQLRTDSFNLDDQKKLIKQLLNYNIKGNIAMYGKGKKKRYYIYLPKFEALNFLKVTHKYIHPSMDRKLPDGWQEVIDLPANYHIRLDRKKDKEYNKKVIIDNLREFYEYSGKSNKFPVVRYNLSNKGYSYKAIYYIFGSWKNALYEAKLPAY